MGCGNDKHFMANYIVANTRRRLHHSYVALSVLKAMPAIP